MRKLCVAVYVLLGALLGLLLTFAFGGYVLYVLVGQGFFWWAGGAISLLPACIVGYLANRLWGRASHGQRSWMLGVGAVTLALLWLGIAAWVYAVA